MESLNEEVDGLIDSDEYLLAEMELLDEIVLAQAPAEAEIESIIEELELLQELGEDEELLDEDDDALIDEFQDLDEFDILSEDYLG